jgi:cytochrome P450
VAGFETTTDLLGNGTAILLDQPQTAAALRSGTITVAGFADEVLLYESPVQLTTRIALLGDLAVHGTPVPRGSQAIVLLGAANRDPARYRCPDTFDPAREDSKPLSFGAGAHFCLGNSPGASKQPLPSPGSSPAFPAWQPYHPGGPAATA